MKLRIIGLLAGIILLSSCGSEKTVYVYSDTLPDDVPVTTDAPRRTLPPTTQNSTSGSYSNEAGFLRGIHSETSISNYVSDSQILELGYLVCSLFRSGYTLDDVIASIMATDGNYEFMSDMSAAIGIAVAWLCDDQMYVFEGI